MPCKNCSNQKVINKITSYGRLTIYYPENSIIFTGLNEFKRLTYGTMNKNIIKGLKEILCYIDDAIKPVIKGDKNGEHE